MKYRLAEGATDYTLCRELMAGEGFPDQEIDFPTVMAIDDDSEVVGLLATTPSPDAVLAGPLVMRHDKRRPFTAIQLIELYELTMRGLGINEVIFWTAKDSFLHRGLGRYFSNLTPYAVEDGKQFYNWPVSRG